MSIRGYTDYVINASLNLWFRATAQSAPANVYVALFTGDPLSGGNEVNTTTEDTAYVRRLITFAAPSAGRVASNVAITFPAVVYGTNGAAYNVTHAAICDALTSGNRLVVGPLPSPVSRVAGETLVMASGSVTIDLARST